MDLGIPPTVEPEVARAFGCSFLIAPSWSLRLSAEDANIFVPVLQTSDFAFCFTSELQLKRHHADWVLEVAPTLTADALRVLHEENAGGASSISECMSMELLARAFNAQLSHTELELLYFPSNGPITDLCVTVGDVSIGVSVTRAMQPVGARGPATFGFDEATYLLTKKLTGVHRSSATCINADWAKQLLHVWAESIEIEDVLRLAYDALPPELTAGTVVLITVCAVPELYNEKRRPPPAEASRPPKPLKGEKDEPHLRVLRESEPKFAVGLFSRGPPPCSSC